MRFFSLQNEIAQYSNLSDLRSSSWVSMSSLRTITGIRETWKSHEEMRAISSDGSGNNRREEFGEIIHYLLHDFLYMNYCEISSCAARESAVAGFKK
jgi:hypothetical protein